MRFLERRPVTDPRRIEDGDIRFHPWPEQTTVGESETLGRKRRHLADGILEGNRIQFADVNSKHARESAVVSGVGTRFSEDRNPSVRRNHCRRMPEDSPKVFLSHRVKDAGTIAL